MDYAVFIAPRKVLNFVKKKGGLSQRRSIFYGFDIYKIVRNFGIELRKDLTDCNLIKKMLKQ